MTLLPCSAEHIVALIDEPNRFAELVGWPAAEGLREFYVSGELSPEWLAALRASSGPAPWRHGFFVVHRDSRRVIGTVGFKGPPDTIGMVEIAYGIVPNFENQGYATEAATALVDFAVTNGDVRLVRAHTLPSSNASTRVLAKCGFYHSGTANDPEDGLVWRWELAL